MNAPQHRAANHLAEIYVDAIHAPKISPPLADNAGSGPSALLWSGMSSQASCTPNLPDEQKGIQRKLKPLAQIVRRPEMGVEPARKAMQRANQIICVCCHAGSTFTYK